MILSLIVQKDVELVLNCPLPSYCDASTLSVNPTLPLSDRPWPDDLPSSYPSAPSYNSHISHRTDQSYCDASGIFVRPAAWPQSTLPSPNPSAPYQTSSPHPSAQSHNSHISHRTDQLSTIGRHNCYWGRGAEQSVNGRLTESSCSGLWPVNLLRSNCSVQC